jgi:predicted CXXCH cytochrome family protein
MRKAILLLGIAIFAAAAVGLLGNQEKAVEASSAPAEGKIVNAAMATEAITPTAAKANPEAYYMGSKVCSGCHAEHYDGWKTTIHPYKIQDASEYTVVGDFVTNNELTVGGYTTKMSKKDGKFYVTTLGQDGKEHTYEVKYTIGGIWKQRYLTEFPNGELHVLPVQWNVDTRQWVDYHGLKKYKPGDENYWSDRNRIWQIKCGSCHTTGLQINYNATTDTFNSTWVDGGAGCEACHGPGSEHVFAPMDKKKETIINPAKIPDARRAAQICGQCHDRGSSIVEAIKVPGGPENYGYAGGAAGYLPGKVLDYFYKEKPGLWPDGSSKKHHQQYYDWKQSKHAEVGINCWNCHTVHSKGAESKHSLRLAGDELCRSCHKPKEGPMELSHSIHDFGSCIECHMPRTAKTAVKTGEAAYDITSHTFKFVSPAETIEHGGLSKQPNSCNACHYHEKDSPEDMLKVLETLKSKKKAALGLT